MLTVEFKHRQSPFKLQDLTSDQVSQLSKNPYFMIQAPDHEDVTKQYRTYTHKYLCTNMTDDSLRLVWMLQFDIIYNPPFLGWGGAFASLTGSHSPVLSVLWLLHVPCLSKSQQTGYCIVGQQNVIHDCLFTSHRLIHCLCVFFWCDLLVFLHQEEQKKNPSVKCLYWSWLWAN